MSAAVLAKEPAGLEQIRALMTGASEYRGIAHLLDFKPIEVEEGFVVFEGHPTTSVYNPIGSVHGGYAATLLDSAMGCAVHSTLPAGAAYTTLEIKVNYIRAMSVETGEVRCEAKAIHVGGRTATAEGRIVDAQGKLYAHGTTTCLIMRR